MYHQAWALERALPSKGEVIMDRHQQISDVIEQAKQQRAEYIASAFRSQALPIAIVAALSLVLLQFTSGPAPEAEVAQVMSQAG
jgi:hypothetical protein